MKYDITREVPVEEAEFLTELDHKLLDESKRAGYKAIAVSVYDPMVKETEYWGRPHDNSRNRVEFLCGEPDPKSKKKGLEDGSPAVWRVTDRLGGSASCGNSQQKQLVGDHKFTRIAYHLREGKWYAQNWVECVVESSLKTLKGKSYQFSSNMAKTTEDHISNIETIKRQMMTIKKLIEAHAENEAFEQVLSKVEKWKEYVVMAKEHIGLAQAHLMTDESMAPEKLDLLIRDLKNKKTADKYGI
jgi:hypothetical protein